MGLRSVRNSLGLRASFAQEFGIDPDAVDPADIDEDYGVETRSDPAPISTDVEDDDDDDDADEQVKVKNPNRSNRLPREFDDRPPLMERCAEVLGARLVEKRHYGFFLDGKPANTDKIVAAAGLQFKDEEPMRKSAPTKQRKRRKKVV